MRGRWLVFLLGLIGCRCPGPVVPVAPAELVVSPSQLVLGPIYVGQRAVGTVELSNLGAVKAEVEVTIDPPFITPVDQLELAHETRAIEVTFAPIAPGQVSGLLKLGALEVELIGEALEVPECTASSVCAAARFDVEAAQCREELRADGSSCETSCVIGACAGGTCVGGLKGCDDHDACTLDACSETGGCSHAPRTCPAVTEVCHVAKCDPLTGCGSEPVLDGTLCGPDECTAVEVDVCITGRCVRRARNALGRCVNRWVPQNIPSRAGAAMGYDAARQRVVLFGGGSGTDQRFDTWEWNGAAWAERIPASSPSARDGHTMAWDAVRQRAVLFGGRSWFPSRLLADLWEWDGTTWLEHVTTTAPPPRDAHGMAFDEARQRLVVFGGRTDTTSPRHDDTWEFDGTSWLERTVAAAPNPRMGHSMAYDPVRQRVVIFGGSDESNTLLSDTWEWDGSSWVLKQPATLPPPMAGCQFAFDARRERLVMLNSGETWEWDGVNWSRATPLINPPPRRGYAIAWDAARERIVLTGGLVGGVIRLSDTWEWDGNTWAQVDQTPHPPPRTDFAMTYDAAARRLVLFGGELAAETWAWNTDWGQLSPLVSPPPRTDHALVYDSARQRVVLVGGRDGWGFTGDLDDTWEWDGLTWSDRTPRNTPSPRTSRHALAYDANRQRVVLFSSRGTWEWDGSSWVELSPATSPTPRDELAMAYDPVRQRVVLFGAGTWEWDGVTWTERVTPSAPPGRWEHAMAWDSSRQRLVLFGGENSVRLDDTWEWDGSIWTQRTPVTSPPRSSGHSMAFHEGTGRIMVLSGSDTWVWYP